jgi:phosphotriesterase-related protein
VGEAEGGDYRGYNTLFEGFIPVLKKQGFTEEEIDVLIGQNPARAFEVKKRKT